MIDRVGQMWNLSEEGTKFVVTFLVVASGPSSVGPNTLHSLVVIGSSSESELHGFGAGRRFTDYEPLRANLPWKYERIL